MRWIIVGLASAIISGQAVAQSSIYDNCRTLITDGLRNYSIYADSASYLNTVYDKYCDSSGSVRSQSLGVGLDLVVKSIPIKFTGSYGSNEEAVRNFCRDYRSVTAATSTHNTYEERVVQRAYDSFDACITMAQTGVIARHEMEGIERVNFYLAPGFSRPVTVRGVSPTPNVTCKGQDPSSSGPPAEITFDTSTRLTLQNNSVLGMVCTRQPTNDASGNAVYDEGMVTVLTDINPKGNYLIFMPKDTKLVENQASAIDAKFQSLKQQTDELRSSIFALKAALREWSGDEVTSDKFGKDEVGGDIPSVDAAKNYGVIYRCKKGTFAVGIYHLSDGIRQQLVCRAINTEGAK